MKGYSSSLVFGVVSLALIYILNYFMSVTFYGEQEISDRIANSYKTQNAMEFAKLNAKQTLRFSIERTKEELGIVDLTIILQDEQQKMNFLEKLKENFDPSLKYSEIEVSTTVESLSVKDNDVIVEIVILSITPERQVKVPYTLKYPIQKA